MLPLFQKMISPPPQKRVSINSGTWALLTENPYDEMDFFIYLLVIVIYKNNSPVEEGVEVEPSFIISFVDYDTCVSCATRPKFPIRSYHNAKDLSRRKVVIFFERIGCF